MVEAADRYRTAILALVEHPRHCAMDRKADCQRWRQLTLFGRKNEVVSVNGPVPGILEGIVTWSDRVQRAGAIEARRRGSQVRGEVVLSDEQRRAQNCVVLR